MVVTRKILEREAELRRMKSTAILINTDSASRDRRARMAELAELAAANTLAFLRGERGPTTVNPQVYETEAYRARTARVRGA